ncbi:MAG: SPOR domain-containing protein, partial [Treponema sp.]
MIKKLTAFISVFFLTTISVWAVWDGNAVSGSVKEFPTGLFASSELFPKHTLIEIINLENNTRSRAVVIGSRGASGVLIRVSPELAQALAIEKDRTVRVRVLAPSLVDEDGADPSYIGRNEAAKAVEPPKVVSEPVKPTAKNLPPPASPENTDEPMPPEPEPITPPASPENTDEPMPPEPEP